MPKYPNHPHHHSSADRARRLGGLRLPEFHYWCMPGPHNVFPPGWVTRRPWAAPLGEYLFYALAVIITVAVVFACVGGIMLWQVLMGPR